MGAEPATATQGPGKITVGDFTIQSGQATEDELREQFSEEIDKDTKEAASKLGKKGAQKKAEKKAEDPAPEPEVVANGDDPEKPKRQASEPEDQDEDSEDQEEEESDKDEKSKKKLGKPKHDPRARMLQATRQAAEAKRERDAALAELEELKSRLDRLESGEKPEAGAKQPKQSESGPQKPKAEDFDDYESYLDARDEWNLQRWTHQAEEEARRRAQMSEQDRALSQAIERFRDSVGQDVSGWSDDVLSLKTEFQLEPGERPDGKNWIANELVFNPESAPSLGLYLSEHPDAFQAIASLPTPRDVSRAMAKLEARLEAATTGTSPEREERSKAAPPVKPVKGAPYVSDGDPAPKPGESFDAWLKRTRPGKPKF